MVAHAFNHRTLESEVGACSEFEASWIYIASSRPDMTIERDYVLKVNKEKLKKEIKKSYKSHSLVVALTSLSTRYNLI